MTADERRTFYMKFIPPGEQEPTELVAHHERGAWVASPPKYADAVSALFSESIDRPGTMPMPEALMGAIASMRLAGGIHTLEAMRVKR